MRLVNILVITILTLPGILPASGTAAASGADFSLIPNSQTVSTGQVFSVNIRVDASEQELDTVQVYLDFDTDYLQAVDGNDNRITGVTEDSIVPGNITSTRLTTRLLNSVDNIKGRAAISYGISPVEGTPPVNEVFILGTIRFKAVKATAATTISFSTAIGRYTFAVRSGFNVSGNRNNSTVLITADGTDEEDSEIPEESAVDEGLLAVTITSPTDGTVTSNARQVITGKVNDTSIRAAMLIFNDTAWTINIVDGYFGEELTLIDGENKVAVTVVDPSGNVTTSRITINLAPESSGDSTSGDTITVATTDAESTDSPQDKPLTWPMMGGIIGGLLLIGTVVYFLKSRSSRY